MKRFSVGCFLLLFIGNACAYACSTDDPGGYTVNGGRSVLSLPELLAREEIRQVLSLPVLPSGYSAWDYSPSGEHLQVLSAPVKKTSQVDIKALETALKEKGMNDADL